MNEIWGLLGEWKLIIRILWLGSYLEGGKCGLIIGILPYIKLETKCCSHPVHSFTLKLSQPKTEAFSSSPSFNVVASWSHCSSD